MLYLSSRFSTSSFVDANRDLESWKLSVQGIEMLDSPIIRTAIWKIWMTTEFFETDDVQNRFFWINSHWNIAKKVARATVGYLYIKQDPQGTLFTIVSPQQDALDHLSSLIERMYDQVKQTDLNQFLRKNRDIPIQSAKLIDKLNKEEAKWDFAHPITLRAIEHRFSNHQWELLAISGLMNIIDPVKTSMFHLNNLTNQAGFYIDEGDITSQNETSLIKNIFTLVDMVFTGQRFVN